MRYMKGAFQDIKKRPVLLIFIMIIGAVICFAEQFNSLTQEFGSLNKLFSTDYVTLISEVAGFIQSKATDPGLMTVSIVIAIVAAIALAAVCGVLFSGFAYTNYITVLDRVHGNIRQGKKTSQIFVEGINKRFGKMTGFFIFFILGAVAVAALSAKALNFTESRLVSLTATSSPALTIMEGMFTFLPLRVKCPCRTS